MPAGATEAPRPFAALRGRGGRPLKVAILSDFVRIPYANGAVFQTRSLYQSLRQCGHEVTIIGPHDPDARVDELPAGVVEMPSVPLKSYPGLHLPLPLAPWVFDPDRWDFDICFAQTTSMLAEFGLWLRKAKGTPLICVNTTHLAAAYDCLLPEKVSKVSLVHAAVDRTLRRPVERLICNVYNDSDGLVVLSDGLRQYWRERGVTVPIHVIPRCVAAEVFDRPLGSDPYEERLRNAGMPLHGPRLLCAGRHTREKSQDRLLRIFAEHVLPAEPDAVLTLVGHGPDTELYRQKAQQLGVASRVLFTGEVSHAVMPDFYRHADVFVHASLSETYGNVLGEALWCGTPAVAMADGMGASFQIIDGVNGILVDPRSPSEHEADMNFGAHVVELIREPSARRRLGGAAARIARTRNSTSAVEGRIAEAFRSAQDHYERWSKPRPSLERHPSARAAFQHFRPWMTVMGGVYLAGFMRPVASKPKSTVHPRIGA